jgi:hypothetical protein
MICTGSHQADRPVVQRSDDPRERSRGSPQHLGEAHPAAVVDDQRLLGVARVPLLADPAVPDAHDPVGHAGGSLIVTDEEQGRSRRPRRLGQQLVDRVGGGSVERTSGLVGEQQ